MSKSFTSTCGHLLDLLTLPANQVFITEQGPESSSRSRPPGCEGPCAPRADDLPGFILWGAGVSLMSVMWDLGSDWFWRAAGETQSEE